MSRSLLREANETPRPMPSPPKQVSLTLTSDQSYYEEVQQTGMYIYPERGGTAIVRAISKILNPTLTVSLDRLKRVKRRKTFRRESWHMRMYVIGFERLRKTFFKNLLKRFEDIVM